MSGGEVEEEKRCAIENKTLEKIANHELYF